MSKTTKAVALSLVCATSIMAESLTIQDIDVNASIESEVIKDIHGEDVKSADLAEALFKQSPAISIVRRSGIANDIILRGMKKDNIAVTIDGTKVCGACPNRMDPPVSHVLTNNIDYITIQEGPFDVETFGALSADVKIKTVEPKAGLHGDINLGVGSWGYQKAAAMISGGNETIKFLVSASTESSEQYKDGMGKDFVGQIQREIDAGRAMAAFQYQDKYKDMDAYEKQTFMGKLFWNITDNQELKLSYTANRSDDILYPSSKMDAIYDDSDIYNLEYVAKNLSTYSKALTLQLYHTEVEHPMSTKYRKKGATTEMTHALTTQVDGATLKNSFDIAKHTVTVGVDYSLRNWDGGYYKNGKVLPEKYFHSIWDVDTENIAFFVKDKINLDRLVVDMGLRYDDTSVDSANPAQQDNDYNDLNGYVSATYQMDVNTELFAGFGKSSRVPDGKELYWISSPMKKPDGSTVVSAIGTPDLDQIENYEFDVTLKKQFSNADLKVKAYYSILKDFIAYNATKKMNRYENVDAKVYGIELSGTYFATDALDLEYGIAYQRGKKDDPLENEKGTNMPEIPPLKLTGAVNYAWDDTFNLRAELVASDSWDRYDAENGEQELKKYAIVNLKASKIFDQFEFTLGIDNLFDKTYAVSNTYKDLILLPTNNPDDAIMLMNEPGRYVYANLKYRF